MHLHFFASFCVRLREFVPKIVPSEPDVTVRIDVRRVACAQECRGRGSALLGTSPRRTLSPYLAVCTDPLHATGRL
jgi:hypothetical protein